MRRKYKLYSVKDFAKMKFKDLIKYIPKDDWVTASTIGDIFSSERDAILFILGYLVGEGKLHAVIRQYNSTEYTVLVRRKEEVSTEGESEE